MKQQNNKPLNPGIFGMQAVSNLKSVLAGFENDVFCIAEDISREQLAEIRRELSLMFHTVAMAYKAVGAPDLMNAPGIVHFEREPQPGQQPESQPDTQAVYRHPDGGRISISQSTARIIITEPDGNSASLPIGPGGCIELARVLDQQGKNWLNVWEIEQ